MDLNMGDMQLAWERLRLRSLAHARMRLKLAVIAFAGLLLSVFGACADRSRTLLHEAYVWQHQWDDALRVALARPQPAFSALRVLALEVLGSRTKPIAVDLAVLAQDARRVRLVVRIEGAAPPTDAPTLAGVLNQMAASWRAAGVRVAGIEIDHDCASARLPDYARWLGDLRSGLSGGELSITALPTWIGNPALPALLASVDHSVLQVHAIDPAGADALFSSESARAWAWAYAQIAPHPFYLALPAYGMRVASDADGRPLRVDAEGDIDSAGPAARELRADPRELALLLGELAQNSPPKMAGIVWFRLPLSGDRRSWSARTLAAVIAGESLQPHLSVQVEHTDAAAADLILQNQGNLDTLAPTRIELPAHCSVADGLSGYALTRAGQGWALSAQAPPWLRAGEGLRIGWARCAPVLNEGWIVDADRSSH